MPRKKTKPDVGYVQAESDNSTDHLDWSKAERVSMPNLKPSTKTISLRLPVAMIDRLKIEANRRDVPYQSYLKVLLAEALERRRP